MKVSQTGKMHDWSPFYVGGNISKVSIDSGSGFLPSGDKPPPESMMTSKDINVHKYRGRWRFIGNIHDSLYLYICSFYIQKYIMGFT